MNTYHKATLANEELSFYKLENQCLMTWKVFYIESQ